MHTHELHKKCNFIIVISNIGDVKIMTVENDFP